MLTLILAPRDVMCSDTVSSSSLCHTLQVPNPSNSSPRYFDPQNFSHHRIDNRKFIMIAVEDVSKILMQLRCIKKVKCILVRALRVCTGRTAHRGSRIIALPFLDHGTRRGEGSASRTVRSLPPGETRYLLYRRLGGPQGRSGQVRKISPPPRFDPRTVQPVAIRYTD
jgi:hypothetical protein